MRETKANVSTNLLKLALLDCNVICTNDLINLSNHIVRMNERLTTTEHKIHRLLGVTQKGFGNVLFNDALNTFYLRLYGVRHMVKDHSDSERGNPLPPHGLFSINSKGSFICTIPQTG